MSVFTFIYNGQETFLEHALVYDQDQSGLSGLTSYPMESMRFDQPCMHFVITQNFDSSYFILFYFIKTKKQKNMK